MRRELRFDGPIALWDEAMPLGNGQTGCLLWGGDRIKLSLDRVDIWDNRPAPETLLPEFTYGTMARAYRDGDMDTVTRLFDHPYSYAAPSKLAVGRIELRPDGPIASMRGALDMNTAQARVTFNNTELRMFVHAADGIGRVRIKGGGLHMAVVRPPYGLWEGEEDDGACACSDRLEALKYPPPRWINEGAVEGFIQVTREEFQYAVLAAKREGDIVFTVAASHDLSYDFAIEKEKLLAALEQGYDQALESHMAWWRAYYAQSDITLPDETMQRLWDVNNYLLACVSRKGSPPMPLQGVFTADNGRLPPWKGDYHNDLNTQMCYLSYLKANHLQAGESFLDFLAALEPQAKKFSAEFFDAPEGLNLPGVMTLDGKPIGGWPMYSFSITNAAWLGHCFSEYYDYSLDEEFLRAQMYPFLKGVGLCVKRWLSESDAGYLELPNSCSPEINDNRLSACFEKNTNYDVALCRFLYGKLAEVCERAGDGASEETWRGILAKLRPLAIGPKGFKINEDFDLEESHRHFSHAMAAHPLRLTRYEGENKQVIDRTIEHLKKLGSYYWCGYSVGWMAELYAVQRNGEAAWHSLRDYAESFSLPNGFHCNGDYKNRGVSGLTYRPFTLEGNMIAMDAVQEMLLQCENGELRVFPAIPAQWAKQGASFRLRAKGALLVSSAIEGGRVQYIRLEAEKDVSIRVIGQFEGEYHLKAGDALVLSDQTE